MRILLNISIQEIKILFRNKTFQVLSIILMLLTIYTLFTSQNRFQEAHSQHKHLSDTVRHMFENQKPTSAHMAGHYGHIVFKPASFLQAIDPGVTPFTGTTVRLEAHKQNEAVFSPAAGQSSLVRFGEFSYSLLLQMVFPLLILFICYRSVIDHRIDGTLKLLVCQGVSIRKLIVSKIIAYTAIFWSFLLITAVLFAAVYSWQGSNAGANLSRTLSLLFVYAIYYLILISVTVYLSARATHTSGLLAGLLASWFILTVIIPKTTANLGSQLYPLPTRQMLVDEIREKKQWGVNGHDKTNKYTIRFKDSVLNAYNVTDEKQLPVKLGGLLMQADEDFNNKLYDETLSGINKITSAQNYVSSVSSFINPFLAVKNLSMATAGTDMHHHFNFITNVENYRRELIKRLNEQDAARTSQFKDSKGKLTSDFYKQTKDYSYENPSLSWALQNYNLEIWGLLSWIILISILIGVTSNKINIV